MYKLMDRQMQRIREALAPLVAIADAYDANNLDDEARKFWGPKLEHTNDCNPKQIELYCGRGGKKLLTLDMCFQARDLMQELKDDEP